MGLSKRDEAGCATRFSNRRPSRDRPRLGRGRRHLVSPHLKIDDTRALESDLVAAISAESAPPRSQNVPYWAHCSRQLRLDLRPLSPKPAVSSARAEVSAVAAAGLQKNRQLLALFRMALIKSPRSHGCGKRVQASEEDWRARTVWLFSLFEWPGEIGSPAAKSPNAWLKPLKGLDSGKESRFGFRCAGLGFCCGKFGFCCARL